MHPAVPRADGGRSDVAADPADSARYLLDRREVEDENEPGPPQDVAFRRPNTKLVAGGYETLPLCRLRPGGGAGAAPELDDTYVPPLLRCDASGPLREGISATARDRLAAADKSSRQMLGRGVSFGSGNPDDLEHLFRLRSVNAALPPVAQLASARGVHPFPAYVELCRAVGQAPIVTDGRRAPTDLPLYDHDDLGGCSRAVLRLLKPDPGGADDFSAPFVHLDDGPQLWAGTEGTWLGAGWRFFIGVLSEMPDAEVARQLFGELQWKVARQDMANDVYVKALDSLTLAAVPPPPRDFPPRPSTGGGRTGRSSGGQPLAGGGGTLLPRHPRLRAGRDAVGSGRRAALAAGARTGGRGRCSSPSTRPPPAERPSRERSSTNPKRQRGGDGRSPEPAVLAEARPRGCAAALADASGWSENRFDHFRPLRLTSDIPPAPR